MNSRRTRKLSVLIICSLPWVSINIWHVLVLDNYLSNKLMNDMI